MAGGNPKGSSSNKPSSSQPNRVSRWESGNKNTPSDNNKSNKNPKNPPPSDSKSIKNPPPSDSKKPLSNPKDDPSSGPSKPSPHQIPPSSAPPLLPPPGSLPFADPGGFGPPPQPAYGFHMLERRTIALADGSVRSYFALPPDYQDLPPQPHQGHQDRFIGFGQGGRDSHFPPPPGGGRLSPPEGQFRREEIELYGRSSGQNDYWHSLGLDGRGGPIPNDASLKRKFGDGDDRDPRDPRDPRDEYARQRQQLLQYGNPNMNPNPNGFPGNMAGTSSPFPLDHGSGRGLDDGRASKHMRVGGDYDGRGDMGVKHHDVDQQALKKAFLRFVKLINENASQRSNYLENGKQGSLQCLACGRPSKDFPDVHALIMHAYGSHSADMHVDHLGLHKALCVLMGWNYAKVPDSSKVYQSLPTNEAEANRDDLILWPPLVIIHNTNTGKGKDGRMEGMGNKVMDNKLKDLGFGGGKAKSLYAKDGHLGITLVKFAADQSGLKEAMRLSDYFEKEYHGRKGWAHAQASLSGRDDDSNPNLVKVDEKNREKQRILYGYLATALDLEKVDFETKKKANIESKRDLKP